MKAEVSPKVMSAIVAVCVVAALVIGWRFLSAPPRDSSGQDLSRPAVQPANIGERRRAGMMDARANQKRGGRAAPGQAGVR